MIDNVLIDMLASLHCNENISLDVSDLIPIV